ncbi:MAG: TetR family transcriptional regulator [Sulfitobacter sp.]
MSAPWFWAACAWHLMWLNDILWIKLNLIYLFVVSKEHLVLDKQNRRLFQRETADVRRQDLIDATLDVISEKGFRGATVREISDRADVTQGLIRHYFSSKEELVNAAYDYHMSQMTELTLTQYMEVDLSAIQRLSNTIISNLTSPVLDERNVILWASFFGKIRSEPGIRQTHEQTYLTFREGLEKLIFAALAEAGRAPSKTQCRRLAIASNALIDGLWIEGGAMPREFDSDDMVAIGLQSIGALIGLDLPYASPIVADTTR